jgi:hypothetical protein
MTRAATTGAASSLIAKIQGNQQIPTFLFFFLKAMHSRYGRADSIPELGRSIYARVAGSWRLSQKIDTIELTHPYRQSSRNMYIKTINFLCCLIVSYNNLVACLAVRTRNQNLSKMVDWHRSALITEPGGMPPNQRCFTGHSENSGAQKSPTCRIPPRSNALPVRPARVRS